MSPVKSKNMVAKILQIYAWLNGIAGAILAIVMGKSVGGYIAVISFAIVLVASFLIYALGEMIELLNQIQINSAKTSEKEAPREDDLPEL